MRVVALSDREFYRDAWAYTYDQRYDIPYGYCVAVVNANPHDDPEPDPAERDEPLH